MSLKPTKYVPLEFSLLGIASILIEELHTNDTVTSLWDRVNRNDKIRTFNRFVEGLTLLYAANVLSIEDGVLTKILRQGNSID